MSVHLMSAYQYNVGSSRRYRSLVKVLIYRRRLLFMGSGNNVRQIIVYCARKMNQSVYFIFVHGSCNCVLIVGRSLHICIVGIICTRSRRIVNANNIKAFFKQS